MILRLSLILSAIFFMGCREVSFKGNLQVDEKLTVKNTDGKLVNLNAGEYPLNFTASKRKVVMKVNKNLEFELLMPKDVQIPENGSVKLRSATTGQPFDLFAEVKTTFQDSESIRGYEDCRAQRWEYVCNPNGCSQQLVEYWGQRRVVYKNRSITRDLIAEFLAKNSNVQLAHSEAVNLETQRVYVSEGRCF
jgi:hypothetical protein